MKKSDKRLYARIAVDRYVDKVFDYLVQPDAVDLIKPGMRALIDFRGKKIYGLIVDISSRSDVPETKVKPLLSLDADLLFLDKPTLDLARWIADYYCAPLGMVLRNIVPSEIRKLKKKQCQFDPGFMQDDLDSYLPPIPHVLNESQKEACQNIAATIDKEEYTTYLLYGVTGSGKTEVYLRSIEHARKKKKQSIIIVPEISLTPQMIETFRTRFEKVALFHSRLTPRQRRHYWLGMKRGFYDIVIGARSAIFAPFENPGLIIVDEEHEHTFKQQEIPFYHARDIAVKRGSMTRSCVILGSATPSLESFSNCRKGKYALLPLPVRVDSKELPEVHVIDMNDEIKKNKGWNPVFSSVLLEEIQKRLDTGEQSILFLNRRGYSTFICCRECGWIAKCEHCSITLTYHKESSVLHCHRCDYHQKHFRNCPSCGKPDLKSAGTGTEKVERLLRKIFPEAKIGRMDTDVTKKKGAYEEILGNFRRGKIDVLVGTQMIAKGLDIPNVTLVGIITADLALNIPDFRSAENTFQLITQVAGRAGRGAIKGDVILQTFSPDLPVIRFAASQDYLGFYEAEKIFRSELNYPPELRFINVCFRGADEVELAKFVHSACAKLKIRLASMKLLFKGPSPSPIRKINKLYRWNMIIGTRNVVPVTRILNDFAFQDSGRIQIVVDVDPQSFL